MLDVLAQMRAQPERARSVLSQGLRDARHLHSRERRLVGDGIREVVRSTALLDRRLGGRVDDGHGGDLARWVLLLRDAGLEEDVAAEVVRRDWTAVRSDAEALAGLGPVERVAVAGSFDVWLAGQLVDSLGDQAEAFIAASAERAPVDLRVNVARGSRDQARTSLQRDGVEVEDTPYSPIGLRIRGSVNLPATDAYRRGLVEVQDEGSQLLSELVDPEEHGIIVDFCAGAGGKTLALAARAPQARILATDVRGRPLSELQKRARRAGIRVRTEQLRPDGSVPDAIAGVQASRVLVDAPCSGTGTLRRHPELRLRLNQHSIEAIGEVQRQVLARAARLVAPGGRLVYGTCSVLGVENRAVVDDFLASTDAFRLVPTSSVFGGRADALGGGAVLQIAPHSQGTDGFFGAVLERVDG